MLPALFIQRLKLILPPEQLDGVMASFKTQKAVSFRVNTLKSTITQAISELSEDGFSIDKLDWPNNAFTIPFAQREQLTHHRLHEAGHIYLQNASSMLPPIVLDPQPGEEVLDLTAAPGSKTTQLAALMNNTGRIAAVEKIKSRFFRLKDNLKLQGASCVDTYLKDGATVWRSCPERFDRVLLDAPCSSEARFSQDNPASFQFWSEQKIKDMSRKQWQLLYSAYQSLKPGGVMVYSTCSFAPEENELMVAKLLKKFKGAPKIADINLPITNVILGLTSWQEKDFPVQLQQCVRILPNAVFSGFFLVKIIKPK